MSTIDQDRAGANAGPGRPYSVSEITGQVKTLLEESLPMCWVIGEISDFTHHSSGHRYFTLKDPSSQLSCVMFKWQAHNLSFAPEPGVEVMAYGHISVYERGGRYQFYAAQLQPAGIGEMALAFEQLKNRLEREGLFAQERKRPLPPYPRTVGVVTSPTGAAIRDIIQVLGRRAPGVQVVLCPARVQGPGAAEEIARGIANLNQHEDIDILIVGRGGGSPEDLWPFNEEIVARAIYTSARPVIAAVGHEVDYTIADYVADYRAPTPSAAAEIVTREEGALLQRVDELQRRLQASMQHRLDHCQQQITAMNPPRLYQRLHDRLEQTSQYVDERRNALASALDWYLRSRMESYRTAVLRLEALSPLSSLARGFVVCQHREDGRLVRSGEELKIGEQVRLRFHRGGALCKVEEIIDE
jgi:exodeoxyribonuclease VII large subunit